MPANWPPLAGTFPAWPPPELNTDRAEFSDWTVLAAELLSLGFSHDAPTTSERALYFLNGVLCNDNHQVVGRMIVSPDGTRRYPFAVCNNAADRELLVLWPPYVCGSQSGPVSF